MDAVVLRFQGAAGIAHIQDIRSGVLRVGLYDRGHHLCGLSRRPPLGSIAKKRSVDPAGLSLQLMPAPPTFGAPSPRPTGSPSISHTGDSLPVRRRPESGNSPPARMTPPGSG